MSTEPNLTEEEKRAKKLAYWKAYNAKHREKKLAAAKASYHAHKEENAERTAAYRAAHREDARLRSKQWREENKERAKAARLAKHAAKPELQKAAHAKYYATHTEQCKATARASRLANIDAAREYDKQRAKTPERKLQGRAYRERHSGSRRKQKAEHYQANKERINAKYAEYAKLNPDKLKTRTHARRAREKGADVGDQKLVAKWIRSWKKKTTVVCFWCMEKIKPDDCHMDHIIPIAKGGAHSVGNLCISCAPCNQRKGDRLPSDWNTSLSQPVLLI